MALRVEASLGKSAPCLVWCHGSSAVGDIMYLICLMTSQDHLIKGSCKFTSGSSLQNVTNLISLVTISIIIEET